MLVDRLHQEVEFWVVTILTPLLTVILKLIEMFRARTSKRRDRRAPGSRRADKRIYAFDLSDMAEEERKSDHNAKMA